MTKSKLNKLSEQETRELENIRECCALYKFSGEYPNSSDCFKWIIATDKAEETLIADFPAAMKSLSPYILVPKEFVSVRRESHANDEKFRYRALNVNMPFDYSDEITGSALGGACVPSFEDELIDDEDLEQKSRDAKRFMVRKLLSEMNEKQRIRLIENVVFGVSCRKIANAENINSYSFVARSVRKAKEIFEKNEDLLLKQVHKATPLLGDSEGVITGEEFYDLFKSIEKRYL